MADSWLKKCENSKSCFQILTGPQYVQMASTVRTEDEMKQDAKKKLNMVADPLEKLRLHCLTRGCCGIKRLARMFRIMNDNGSKQLEYGEFQKGLRDYGLKLEEEELKRIFGQFDKDNSGNIDFDEFLIAIRPSMSQWRHDLVMEAFKKLDKSGDGLITVDDMNGLYNVDRHSKYVSGELTKEQLFKQFLKSFEIGQHPDGMVTKDEFINYYAGLSASVDNDMYFDLMMRNCWKL